MALSSAERYEAAARQHGKSTSIGEPDAANRAYVQMMEALQELHGEADQGRSILSKLVSHSDDWVKIWASTHLLPLAEIQARAILERIASGPPSLVEFNAKMVLQEWRAGRLRSL